MFLIADKYIEKTVPCSSFLSFTISNFKEHE